MGYLILAIGLVLCVEGLVLALAPSRLDEILKALADIPFATRRRLGIAALAGGIALVALARGSFGI